MIVIFWLFVPFFVVGVFVLVLDFIADTIMSMAEGSTPNES